LISLEYTPENAKEDFLRLYNEKQFSKEDVEFVCKVGDKIKTRDIPFWELKILN